jgi:hypothetical protein
VVLVGDHCQLPPVVQGQQAAQQGLQLSLFERLIQAGLPSAMLQVGGWWGWAGELQRSHGPTHSLPHHRVFALRR